MDQLGQLQVVVFSCESQTYEKYVGTDELQPRSHNGLAGGRLTIYHSTSFKYIRMFLVAFTNPCPIFPIGVYQEMPVFHVFLCQTNRLKSLILSGYEENVIVSGSPSRNRTIFPLRL